jgi:hypothetical protein
MKNKLFFGVLIFIAVQSFVFLGCASIKPLSEETMSTYGLLENIDKFKNYQYFVSRDIVLTATNIETDDISGSGRAGLSTRIDRDVIQLLSSTAGKCLEVDTDFETYVRIGIEFDAGSNNMLWFYFDNEDEYFYLDYTNRDKNEIEYSGKIYVVSYEQAKGISATFKRLITPKKAESADYQNMEPLLLYEENIRQAETEKRRTLGGSRL